MKNYRDLGFVILALAGQVLVFLSLKSGSGVFFGLQILLFTPLLLRYLLYALEAKDRQKKSQKEEKIIERSGDEIVRKSRHLSEAGLRTKSRVSSIFLHLKELASSRKEEELIHLFVDLISKHLPFQRITYFSVDPDEAFLMVKETTDLVLSREGSIQIPIDETSLLGYAGLNKVGLEKGTLKQNLKIAHLDTQNPVSMEICTPILYDDEIFGIINVGEVIEEGLKQEDRQFFSALCTLLGLSLKSARSFGQIEEDLIESQRKVEEKEALNERIRGIFGKFTSPNVVNALIENRKEIALGGQTRDITLLFADIRNFTSYCEKHIPEQVVKTLNDYLTRMSQVIIKYDGTLDKYIGDEIMAFWGAPLEQAIHAKLAVQAGYEMVLELKKLLLQWEKDGTAPFTIGVGMNSGKMIVGNVGSSIRMDYTVIGDSVNLAARVERLTRKFRSDFLITEYTYQQVKDIVKARKIGALQVVGKEAPVIIYSVEWVDLKPLVQ
ncbi:hypothetical protein HOF92_11520 [bacterium]|nr:hypothetical protein [bacterium]